MLPYWNGQGLASPKYGNIAIEKLIDKMIQAEEKFMECINSKTPPPLTSGDYTEIYDIEFLDAAFEYAAIDKQIIELTAKKEGIKQKLLTFSEGKNCIGGGVKITQNKRKGSIDFLNIPELTNIDLEQYRGPEKTYTTINIL